MIERLWVRIPAGVAEFSSPGSTFCAELLQYPFHPCVTTGACERSRSFCQKCRWQVTAKHAYTLCMWLRMKWHGAWLYVVQELVPRRQQFHVAPAMPALKYIITSMDIKKMCCNKKRQWVCSREWRIVLYKRSSVNNLDLLPIGAAWSWGARTAGLAARVAGDQWQHSEPSQWLLGQQDGGTQWKWANTFNVSVVCELQTTFSHPWFHHPHFWFRHRSTFSHLCSVCQCRFGASGRSISGGGTVRNEDCKKKKKNCQHYVK